MKRLKSIVFGSILLPTLTGIVLGQSRGCSQLPTATATRWGGNERVVIDLRNKPVRTVRGTVFGPEEGTYKTLVQVFPQEPSDPRLFTSGKEKGLPVAVCETGDDGVFGFSLPPGEYELLMSQNPGVDVTAVLVTVKRGWRRSRKISATMHVGT